MYCEYTIVKFYDYCREPYAIKVARTVREVIIKLHKCNFIIIIHPYILAGQIATAYYFIHYLGITPLLGLIDNVLSIIGSS
jgi:hypothetical protein